MLRSIFRAKAFSFLSRRRRRWSCSNTLDYRTVGEENSEASPTHDIVLSQTSSTSVPPNKKSKNKTSRKGCQQPVSCIRMSLPLHHSLFSFASFVAILHLFSCCLTSAELGFKQRHMCNFSTSIDRLPLLRDIFLSIFLSTSHEDKDIKIRGIY